MPNLRRAHVLATPVLAVIVVLLFGTPAIAGPPSDRLRDFFTKVNAGPASPYAYLGNEPTLGTPWLYDWAGRPAGAASVVRRALLSLYADTAAGLPGRRSHRPP